MYDATVELSDKLRNVCRVTVWDGDKDKVQMTAPNSLVRKVRGEAPMLKGEGGIWLHRISADVEWGGGGGEQCFHLCGVGGK